MEPDELFVVMLISFHFARWCAVEQFMWFVEVFPSLVCGPYLHDTLVYFVTFMVFCYLQNTFGTWQKNGIYGCAASANTNDEKALLFKM